MRHRIHERIVGPPQVNACASSFGLDDCDIETRSLEVTPYLWAQCLLSRTVHLHNVIALLNQCLGDQIVIRTECREDDDGLTQRCHQLDHLLELIVAEVMKALVVIINEARGDLPAFRYIRDRQLSKHTPTLRFR